MKILFVIESLSLPGGGAERILTLIANALAGRGHDVTILSFDRDGAADFYRVDAGVRRIREGSRGKSGPGPWTKARRPARLRAIAQSLRPEVAVGFMYSAFIPLSAALVGTGIPVIGSERTSFAHYRSRPFLQLLLHASLPLLARLTVNGEAVRKGFPRWIASKMTVVPNPVAAQEEHADPIGPGTKTLLSVGGLRPEKDHTTLVTAFADIAGRFPDWRLRIVGEGPLRSRLETLVASLGLSERVELPGASEHVDRAYRAAQLFVLPSLYEAFPNCLAEALAHGLPSIAFADCPGANDLITDGLNGRLAAANDRRAGLSAALEQLMASPSHRRLLGEAAPQTVRHYAIGEITDRWEQLFLSVVESNAIGPV